MIGVGARVRTPSGRTGMVTDISHGGARAQVRYDATPSWQPRVEKREGGHGALSARTVCLKVEQLRPA